jgi:hypothetical protein
MKIFWHQGGLHVHPESKREGQTLAELLNHLTISKPPEAIASTGSGESSSGKDLFDSLTAEHQILPRGDAVKTTHKQSVVRINKLP